MKIPIPILLSLIVCSLSSTTTARSSEIFDPFSRLDDYLRYRTDQRSSQGNVGFYVDTGYLAGFESRRTRLVLMVTIPESALRFVQDGDHFSANYRLSFYWKELRSREAQERVWNRKLERSSGMGDFDALHTFRTVIEMREGRYKFEVEIEDRNVHKFGRVTYETDVPDLPGETPSLSTIFLHTVPAELEKGAGERIPIDELNVQPLALYPYKGDRVAYYIEGYGIEDAEANDFRWKVDLVDSTGSEIWSAERPIETGRSDHFFRGDIGKKRLDLGRYRLGVTLIGPGDRIASRCEKPFYVTGNDRWLEDNFDFTLDFLHHIAGQAELDALKNAPEEERLSRWRDFWKKRDPLPATPVNEAQVEFYRRIQYANQYFTTHIEKGWSTDRGRVYIALGSPDEVIIRDNVRAFGRWETWIYDRSLGFKVILYFEDRGFTDDYRLVNPGEFIRAKSQLE